MAASNQRYRSVQKKLKYCDNTFPHNSEQCERHDNVARLKSMSARLVACNGDCGSKIARIINQCVNGHVM